MNEKIKQILNLIEQETDIDILRKSLNDVHPYDLAHVFNEVDEETRQKLYIVLDDNFLADIFEHFEDEDAVDYLKELKPDQITSILEEMEVDDAIRVLKEIDDEKLIQEYIQNIEQEAKENLNQLRKYEDNTAGAMMTTNYIEIESDIDIKKAMKILLREANEAEVIDPLFVTKNGYLVGILGLKDLIIARSPMTVNEIMETNPIFVELHDDRNEVINKINDYDISAMPVLDNGLLEGIITIDDVIDAVEDDVTNHFGKLAAVRSDFEEETSIKKTLLKRLPWLVMLLAFSLIISNVIGIYEDVIRQVTVLVFFQTLLLDMAGNIGTQSLAVAIRTLLKGEIDDRKKLQKYVLKEVKINLLNSIILGVMAFGVSFLFLTIINAEVEIRVVALVVGMSMTLTLIISGLLGVFFPFFFNKIGIDPAVASGPLITTMNDIISVLIYFSLAMAFLNIA